jgi:O-Antigen ligase
MGAYLAVATAIKGMGVIAVAAAAAGAFVMPSARARAIAVLLALALTPVLLVGEVWGSPELESVRDRPTLAAGALAAGLALVGALAVLFLRRPTSFPIVVVLALPFRLPVEAGDASANLLVPLYLVVAAGGVAYAWERLRGEPRDGRPAAGRFEMALLAAVLLYAVQATYSSDFEQALKNVVFFYVPFALLLKLLLTVRWTRALAAACFGAVVVLALLFAAIGFWEYGTRELLWNRRVIESNEFESYFRVNSLFFDPNIYGRFLALTMVGLAAWLLWGRRTREALVAAATLAVLWGGLVLTFSQSSFAALLVGLIVLAALRWGARPVAAVTAAAIAAALVAALAFPGPIGVDLASESSVDDATSGRFDLAEGGLSMWADRPLLGFGSGSFAATFREREDASSRQASSASHTAPLTVAAEQGLPGLAVYVWLLLAAAGVLLGGLGALRDRGPPSEALVARAAVAAAFASLLFHTMTYAAFLEDPITWALAAAGLVLSRRATRA